MTCTLHSRLPAERKPKGRKGYPPLKDEWDIDRDFDAKLAVEQTESPYGLQYGSKEGGRGIAVLRWARAFLRYKTGDESIVDNLKSVHSGLTGATKLPMNIIRIATARAGNLKDLNIEQFRAAGEIPEEKVLTILQKYLGQPRWYLDWHYVTRNNLRPSLQSGAFQALVGIAVNFDPAGASDNEQVCCLGLFSGAPRHGVTVVESCCLLPSLTFRHHPPWMP
ncbi:hypothetical protein TRAPUB_4669 [Trametes pubescens]|uniref:Uncharacterized protein n=1 Tax=Trametes pubescens TaxID=154538 RepID=A0A1M2VAH7_TRAPU|nr:hypothetical protein TRAPUB_4669 [Trametes pubescens]